MFSRELERYNFCGLVSNLKALRSHIFKSHVIWRCKRLLLSNLMSDNRIELYWYFGDVGESYNWLLF